MPEWAANLFGNSFGVEYDDATATRVYGNVRAVLEWCDEAGINPPKTYGGKFWFDSEQDAIAFKLVWMTE